eukprot:TRINITY_DN2591_c0_g1_i2.p1 TRINITY_DN2591_c0_g1~~TRINITY_DN2591_c0_g1_i2.p1  ORF type:complete len:635 (+),score=223.76 TRINITY_DN2591_c0_g1_i2:45-1907(+)
MMASAVRLCLLGLLCAVPCACHPFICSEPSGGCPTGNEARSSGLRRLKAERDTHPLKGFKDAHPSLAQAITETCEPASRARPSDVVPDEWSVCMRRGKSMADDLLRFHPVKDGTRFSRKDVMRVVKLLNPKIHLFGVWARVEDGVLTQFGEVGKGWTVMAMVTHWAAFNAFAADLGAFAGKTFEMVALVGDGCMADPFIYPNVKDDPYTHLPLASYSKSKECDHHIVVPTSPWLHTFVLPSPMPRWDELNNTAFFRGSLYPQSPLRAALGFISALGLVKDTDFAFSGCGDKCLRFASRFHSDPQTPYFHNMPDNKTMCRTGMGCSSGYADQTHYKPLMVTDGIGAVTRFFNFFAAPGVVVSLESEYEQFFSKDVVPMVHYIELNSSLASFKDSLTQGLQWLRENDAAAEEMSRQAALYFKEHLTVRNQVRSLQLFAALMSRVWDDSHYTPVPARANGTDPNTLADDFQIYRKGTPSTGLSCSTARQYMTRVQGHLNAPYQNGCGSLSGTERMSAHRAGKDASSATALPATVKPEPRVPSATPMPNGVAAGTPDVLSTPLQPKSCGMAVPFWLLLSGILLVTARMRPSRSAMLGIFAATIVLGLSVSGGAMRGSLDFTWTC